MIFYLVKTRQDPEIPEISRLLWVISTEVTGGVLAADIPEIYSTVDFRTQRRLTNLGEGGTENPRPDAEVEVDFSLEADVPALSQSNVNYIRSKFTITNVLIVCTH